MAQYKKDIVRDSIVEAALELFFKHGYHNTTIKDIAVRAKTSIGNTYRYFANKEEIYYAVITPEFVDSLKELSIKRTNILHKKHFNFPLTEEENSWYENDYFNYLINNRKILNILHRNSEGTRYEQVIEDTVDNMLREKIELLNNIKQLNISREFADTLSLIIVKTIDMNAEVLSKNLEAEGMKRLLKNIDYFYHKGISALWNKMMDEGQI